MTVVENGYERPVVTGDLSNASVDRIYDVCPGLKVDGLPDRLICNDTLSDPVWGPYRKLALAYATNPDIRFKASTGGVITALSQYLLSSKQASFILHIKTSNAHPMFGERHLSFTDADVMEAMGSRYGPSAPLIDVRDVLDRGTPFAFAGKPCDIAALRNYARHDERVDKLVKFWLAPVCGGFLPPAVMAQALTGFGVMPDDVTSLRYRGYGCPGPTRIETRDGRVIEKNYVDFWGEDESSWSLPFRCKVCPDGIGESADVAAADTWPGGGPARDGQELDKGTNAVIARTKAGEELIEKAVAAGFLTVEREIGIEDLNSFQPHQVNKKYAAWARHKGLKAAGQLAPQTKRLRIAELAAKMGADFITAQSEGTQQRVRDGKTREPPPRRN